MKRILIPILLLVSFSSQTFARKRDWTALQKLRPGTSIQVELWHGPTLAGKFRSADGSGLRLALWDGTPMEEIARASIHRVIQEHHQHLRDPHKLLVAGAVVGGAAAATAVAVLDNNDCQGCKGFRIVAGGAAGAWLGFMGAAVIGVAVGVADLFHHNKITYENPRPPADLPKSSPRLGARDS